MSGILLPHVTFANAINDTETVNVDNMQSVQPIDIPAINNNPAEYILLFTSKEVNSATKDVKIRFEVQSDRDAAHTAYLAAVSAAL